MADKISTLPDQMLCHILSFLPTEDAVRTSILSNRWKALWLSVPTIDFSDESSSYYLKVKDDYNRDFLLLYTVLLSRDAHQPINRFCLKFRYYCDPYDVNIWVNTATQRRVQHLELFLDYNINLPSSVLTTTTLVVLKLCNLTVNDAVSSVSLPSLKTLHLESVRFEDYGYVLDLLSGCTILEDLRIESLDFFNVVGGGELKSLSKLVRADISKPAFDIPLKVFYNVEFLRTDSLSLGSWNDIPIFHNLIHMELIFAINDWDWLLEVLKICPKLQILVIDKVERNPMLNRSDDENWAYPQLVPKCLSSHLRACSIRGYEGSEGELRFATYILQNARALQTMKICSPSYISIAKA